jgi:hypothetical protein
LRTAARNAELNSNFTTKEEISFRKVLTVSSVAEKSNLGILTYKPNVHGKTR